MKDVAPVQAVEQKGIRSRDAIRTAIGLLTQSINSGAAQLSAKWTSAPSASPQLAQASAIRSRGCSGRS
ncbi:hypothetical protein EYF80_033240 [Liparis tanakae]|uniref:Uncharacterized protein n=1 Tax=Liparis tanakae TaxID=230148 RepID=A0A4Z2GV77_9TELE|nr:hypothetical protein EYF80_033240 [Liparis tanakae]